MEIIVPQFTILQSFGIVILYGLLWFVIGYSLGRKSGISDGLLRGQKQGFYDAFDKLDNRVKNGENISSSKDT